MIGCRVAVVEDDARMRATVVRGLRDEGLQVPVAVGTGAEFLDAASRGLTVDEAGRPWAGFDVAVLDVGLPDCDGRDLCLALRARGVEVPVLFLTARDAVADRLLGFSAGADDYLVKPFAFAELVARVSALGRRYVRAAQPVPAVGGVPGVGATSVKEAVPTSGVDAAVLTGAVAGGGPPAASLHRRRARLDPVAHALLVAPTAAPSSGNGASSRPRTVRLTPTEFRLLSALMARPGEVLRRRALVAAGWVDGSIVHDNTLDAYIARIRRKLRSAGADVVVTTVHGVGYQVEP